MVPLCRKLLDIAIEAEGIQKDINSDPLKINYGDILTLSMPYRECPLDPKGTEIRVLKLFPGDPDGPLRCRLETVDFGPEARYEALSYV